MGLLSSSFVFRLFLAAVIFTFVLISTTNCFDGQSKVFSIPFNKMDRRVYNRTRNGAETDFYVEIRVGTPPQKLHAVFDTSYADMWVRSSSDVKCIGGSCYDHRESNSYVKNGTEVITNESGSQRGSLSQDIFQVGRDWGIGNLTFAEVTGTETDALDGVVGLGFRDLSRFMTPVFIAGYEKGLFEENIFAFYYNKSNPNASEFTFGGWNKKILESGESIHWVPVTERRHWKVKMEGVVMGGLVIKARAAIADTGSAMILGPRNDTLKIAKYFKGQLWGEHNIVRVPKANFKDVSSIVFMINRKNYTIPAKEIIIEEIEEEGYLLALGTRDNINHWVLGDRFLSNYYTIFDVGKGAVGFAPLTGQVSPSAFSSPPRGVASPVLMAAVCSVSISIGIAAACSAKISYSRRRR